MFRRNHLLSIACLFLRSVSLAAGARAQDVNADLQMAG